MKSISKIVYSQMLARNQFSNIFQNLPQLHMMKTQDNLLKSKAQILKYGTIARNCGL